jgi:thymidylate kinase
VSLSWASQAPARGDVAAESAGRVHPGPHPNAHPHLAPRSLVVRLAATLHVAGVPYVQWKGQAKQTRWMSGEGDIDLLVDRSGEARFRQVLSDLGFRRADPPRAFQLAGIESYYGLDPATGRLIHVHAHYRLITGSLERTVYRLPIEHAALNSAIPAGVFRVPAPEFELIAFAVRMAQRHTLRDALRRQDPPWLAGIQAELQGLRREANGLAVAEILAADLPSLNRPFIEACLDSLAPGSSRWGRLRVRWELDRRMRAHARRPPLAMILSRVARRARALGGGRGEGMAGKHRAHGGTVIALVGGDGAGKSTCAEAVRAWLAGDLALLHAHLGRPPRSLVTLAVGAVCRLARVLGVGAATDDEQARTSGYLAALRDVCTARDRYRLYAKARQFALAGGIALCERYPIPENQALSGPRLDAYAVPLGRTRLGRRLAALEAWYYRQILPPDLLIVLRVDPEVAVRRKTTEPAEYVRARSRLVWNTDWRGTGAHVVDAGRPLADVVADLKAVLWWGL